MVLNSLNFELYFYLYVKREEFELVVIRVRIQV